MPLKRSSRSLAVARRFPCAVVGLSVAVAPLAPARADDVKRACVAASTDGQTLRKEDKLVEARDKLRICASEICPEVVRARCTHWLTELEEAIPSVIVRATDDGGDDLLDADVAIDGAAVKLGRPVTLDPGEHTVVVKRPNGDHEDDKFLLVDGERSRILTLHFAGRATADRGGASASASAAGSSAPAPAAGGGIPLGAWILGGVGVVGLGGFAFFLAEAASDYNGLKSTCSPHCSDDATRPVVTNADISYVSLGVGIAALAGAVTWAIVARPAKGGGAGKKAEKAEKHAGYGPSVDVRPVAGGAVTVVGVRF